MNEDRLRTLLRGFHLNEGASSEHISDTEKQLRIEFPEDYREFLQRANGGEGAIGEESYLILWSVDELLERNAGYKFDEHYAPDLTLIGTDGGNEVFAIRATDGLFVSAPLIGMSREAVHVRGGSLVEFLESFS